MRLVACVCLLLLSGCVASSSEPSSSPGRAAPVVGAIGNSLMLGYNADWDHVESAPEIAWGTGDAPWSFQARLGAAAVENAAQPGGGVDAFLEQADALERATLVLVLLMADDVCPGPPEDAPPFEDALREGVRHLQARGMAPMLVSPPDITRVAEAARTKVPANDFALFYGMGQACALDPGTPARQAAMWETIARVAEDEGALHDHGALASLAWTPEMVSEVDGLHPSPVGLEAIASAVWDAYEASTSR